MDSDVGWPVGFSLEDVLCICAVLGQFTTLDDEAITEVCTAHCRDITTWIECHG